MSNSDCDGCPIGEQLSFSVTILDRASYMDRDDCPEAEFLATGKRGGNVAISSATWRLNNVYDRPTRRRLAGFTSVVREAFGQQEKTIPPSLWATHTNDAMFPQRLREAVQAFSNALARCNARRSRILRVYAYLWLLWPGNLIPDRPGIKIPLTPPMPLRLGSSKTGYKLHRAIVQLRNRYRSSRFCDVSDGPPGANLTDSRTSSVGGN